MTIHPTHLNASTAFGTATGTEEKKPPVKPASDGVLTGGCIHQTYDKSQFITLTTSDVLMLMS